MLKENSIDVLRLVTHNSHLLSPSLTFYKLNNYVKRNALRSTKLPDEFIVDDSKTIVLELRTNKQSKNRLLVADKHTLILL